MSKKNIFTVNIFIHTTNIVNNKKKNRFSQTDKNHSFPTIHRKVLKARLENFSVIYPTLLLHQECCNERKDSIKLGESCVNHSVCLYVVSL